MQLIGPYVLEERTSLEQIQRMKDLFMECSNKYFMGEWRKKPIPNFVIKAAANKYGAYAPARNFIQVHPDLFSDEEALKSVMYHETIHFWDFDYNDAMFRFDKGHGKFFKDKMEEINAKEGKKVVTIKSVKLKLKTKKKFWILAIDYRGGIWGLWTKKDPFKGDEQFAAYFERLAWKYNNGDYYSLETDEHILQIGPPATLASLKKRYSIFELEGNRKETFLEGKPEKLKAHDTNKLNP